MSENITLYSFIDADRSSKVRWTACELGMAVTDERVAFGEHIADAYRKLNPYSQVPTVIWRGQTLVESGAIMETLARAYPESGLIPDDGGNLVRYTERFHLANSTLEFPAVAFRLSKSGILDAAWGDVLGPHLKYRIKQFASESPGAGYQVPGQFTLADISAAYVYLAAIAGGLIANEGAVADYLQHLSERPGAIESRFFDD